MKDFIGVRKFCSSCKYSTIQNTSIICENKKSSFHGLRVNNILCAPCIDKKEIPKDTVIETVSFD